MFMRTIVRRAPADLCFNSQCSIRHRVGLIVYLAVSLTLTLYLPLVSGQTLPPSLVGEQLIGTGTLTGTCNLLETGTYQFTFAGEAIGPYPGTYTGFP
jgi:hypothetical protein